ncbi:MAG: DNA polymerase III subunit delta [Pseudorhodobacter sp.]
MKLSGAKAAQFLARPDPARAGFLIHGSDPMQIAMKRQEAIAALIGPAGEEEMRLTRIAAADARRDAAALPDAMRAPGFFPGPRVVFLEDATDGLAKQITAALDDWCEGDANIIVTAGELKGNSTLRKLFEGRSDTVAIGFADEPPGSEEIEAELTRAGLTRITPETMANLTQWAQGLPPGDFRQMLEKITLYKWGDEAPLSPEDITQCAPGTMDADLDEVIDAAAEGRAASIGALMRRLEGQGVNPVTICIMALRHFRALHLLAWGASGPGTRLPVFGPRRAVAERQARRFSRHQSERALRHLVETDLTLRSSSRAPGMAVVERALIRIASTK